MNFYKAHQQLNPSWPRQTASTSMSGSPSLKANDDTNSAIIPSSLEEITILPSIYSVVSIEDTMLRMGEQVMFHSPPLILELVPLEPSSNIVKAKKPKRRAKLPREPEFLVQHHFYK